MTSTPDNAVAEPGGLSRKNFLRAGGLSVAALATATALPGTASAAASGRKAETGPVAADAVSPAVAGAGASGTTGGPIMNSDRFPIGLFWPPPPLETTVERYQEIADAGFTFAHGGNYTWADPQIARQMLAVAEQAGLDVLVDDADLRFIMRNLTISDSGANFTFNTAEATAKLGEIVARYAPQWQLSGGRLLINGGSGNGSIGSVTAGKGWTDYTLEFATAPRPTGAGGYAQAGWAFRMTDENNAYVWLLSTQGPGNKAVLKKAVFVGGGVASLTQVVLPYQLDLTHTYQIKTSAIGSVITTSIDGVLVDTTTDTTYSKGTVGFREAGPESAYFDNLTVTATNGTVLFRETFDSLAAWTKPAGAGYSSFAGMHLYDEPSAGQLPNVAKALDIINAAYPDALTYVNQLPGFGVSGYEAAAKLNTPVISFDRYPILAQGEDTGYFQNLAQVRDAALKYGRAPWIYIQSVGYSGHATPTEADLRWQISICLAFGYKGIQYFTYWTPDPARGEGFHDGLITVDGKRTPLYQAARRVNTRYLAPLGKQLLNLSYISVQGAGIATLPPGLASFVADDKVAAVSGGAVVIGRFAGADGSQFALVANYSRGQDIEVTITLGAAATGVQTYQPMQDTWKPVRGRTIELDLDAGAAQLIRLA